MQKTKIHVVDDETDILDLYVNLLSEDFEVAAFSSPKLFLNALKDGPPDLVITDLKMPQMNGIEMVREAQRNGSHFPFILLSGHLDKEAAVTAMDIGAFRLLEKPTGSQMLLATIDQLLVEHEIIKVRAELRTLTSQMREIYTSLRIIMTQYIPDEVLSRLVVRASDSGQVEDQSTFDDLLEKLEARLDQLLNSERLLVEIKNNKFKA